MECPYNRDELQTRFNLILDRWGWPTVDTDHHDGYSIPIDDNGERGDVVIAPGEPRYVVYVGDGMSTDVWLVETPECVLLTIADALVYPGDPTVTKVFDLWGPAPRFDTPLDVYVVVRASWDDADGSDIFVEDQVMVSSAE